MQCGARRYLRPEDWDIVMFYGRVQDQVVNLSPMGLEDGGAWLAPRLEGWETACRIYDVPDDRRTELIDGARMLHNAINGDSVPYGLHRMAPDEMKPPPVPHA